MNSLSSKDDINDEEYIHNIVHEIWNESKINLKKLNKLLEISELRVIFFHELNRYRSEGIFCIDEIPYQYLVEVFNQVLNISYKQKDFESIERCMILSQTFYKSNYNQIPLQRQIMKNEIWKNKKIWEDLIEFSINNGINLSKEYNIFLEENEKKRDERVKNAVKSALFTFSYNMGLFKVPKKEMREIINKIVKKYKIEDFTIYENEQDINEVEEKVLEEAVISNIDINPIKEEESKGDKNT